MSTETHPDSRRDELNKLVGFIHHLDNNCGIKVDAQVLLYLLNRFGKLGGVFPGIGPSGQKVKVKPAKQAKPKPKAKANKPPAA